MKSMKRTSTLILFLTTLAGVPCMTQAADRTSHAPAIDPAEVARCAETARNRAVITAFADVFYRQGDIERAMMTYVVPDYIQHSPGVPNGRAAMLEMAKRFAGHPKPKFDIKRIVVDGDIAVIHIRGQLNPQLPPESVFDMFRLEDGKIVEHWDVRQAVPATSANTNTMF